MESRPSVSQARDDDRHPRRAGIRRDDRARLEAALLAHALIGALSINDILDREVQLSASAALLVDMLASIPATVRGVGFSAALAASLTPDDTEKLAGDAEATIALAERADALTVRDLAEGGLLETVVRALGGRSLPAQRQRGAMANHNAPGPRRVERLGALALWRRELRAGVEGQRPDRRSTWRLDALWRAACYEARALEAMAFGLHTAAGDDIRSATAILADARRAAVA